MEACYTIDDCGFNLPLSFLDYKQTGQVGQVRP